MEERLKALELLVTSQPLQAAEQLQSFLLSVQGKETYHEAYALCLLGGCAFFQGNVKQCLEYVQRSDVLARQHGWTDLSIRNQNAQGLSYWRLGQLPQALEHFQNSLALAGEKDPTGRSRVLNNLACVYLDLEDYEQARDYFTQAVSLSEQTEEGAYFAEALVGLAELDLEEERYEAVLQAVPRIRELLSQRPQSRLQLHMRRVVMRALFKLGRYAEGLSCGENGLRDAQAAGDAEAEALLLWTQADLCAATGHLSEARAHLERSARLAEQIGHLRLKTELKYTEAHLLRLSGQTEQGFERLEEYIHLKHRFAQQNRRLQSQAIAGQVQIELLEREAQAERERNAELTRANEMLQATQSELSYRASHDVLTDLLNRSAFWAAAHERLEGRPEGTFAGLIFADIDHLKTVNDNYGHAAGDALIREIAHRFQTRLGPNDLIGRLSGDEFMIYLDQLADPDDIERAAQGFLEVLREPLEFQGADLTPHASLGGVVAPDDGSDITQLHHHADLALYQAKQQGKNTWARFRAEISAGEMRRRQLREELKYALGRGQFELNFQPQFKLPARELVGFEALLRWHHPLLGPVSPAEFIPVAEESAQVVELGEWVLEQACRQAKEWKFDERGLVMSVNVSVRQFERPDFVERVAARLSASDLPGHCLVLELTETLLHREPQASVAAVEALHQLGVRIAIDDFGTGYSSMSLLRQLPFRQLKIDRSFVSDLGEQSANATSGRHFMEVMLNLAHGLGMRVVAEGVETQKQLDLLCEMGCDKAQGYLLARPAPASQVFAQFLAGEERV